mgnify:CR=1 FL=1
MSDNRSKEELLPHSWQPIAPAPENVEVMTKIDDSGGARNEQSMIRHGRLWFIDKGGMYVYYMPTHWRPL